MKLNWFPGKVKLFLKPEMQTELDAFYTLPCLSQCEGQIRRNTRGSEDVGDKQMWQCLRTGQDEGPVSEDLRKQKAMFQQKCFNYLTHLKKRINAKKTSSYEEMLSMICPDFNSHLVLCPKPSTITYSGVITAERMVAKITLGHFKILNYHRINSWSLDHTYLAHWSFLERLSHYKRKQNIERK